MDTLVCPDAFQLYNYINELTQNRTPHDLLYQF